MKLIRDKMLDIEWTCEELKKEVRPYADAAEYKDLLDRKLLEEAAELIVSYDERDVLEEAADVFEVLLCVCSFYGHSYDDLMAMANTKREVRGSFLRGLVLNI